MTDQPQNPEVTDPDNVPEILYVNVAISRGLATLTLTHVRPDPTPMFSDTRIEPEAIGRARIDIVLTLTNLIVLRDLLTQAIETLDAPAPPAGGPTRH
jgi:hypothetical protein